MTLLEENLAFSVCRILGFCTQITAPFQCIFLFSDFFYLRLFPANIWPPIMSAISGTPRSLTVSLMWFQSSITFSRTFLGSGTRARGVFFWRNLYLFLLLPNLKRNLLYYISVLIIFTLQYLIHSLIQIIMIKHRICVWILLCFRSSTKERGCCWFNFSEFSRI